MSSFKRGDPVVNASTDERLTFICCEDGDPYASCEDADGRPFMVLKTHLESLDKK